MVRGKRRSKSAVTLRMVAAHAEVSPMSVSNFLNGRPVSQRTRAAVLQAIDELGYVPNQAARQLASAAPMFIGLVHSNDEHPISNALLTGTLRAASRLGIQMLLQPITFEHIDEGWDAVRTLRSRGAEGIILPPVFGEAMAARIDPEDAALPLMCVGATNPLETISTVRIDEFAAAREMTQMLIAKGHRRIGFLRVPPEFPIHHARGGGYMAALRDHGLPVDADLIVEANYFFQEGLTATHRLLDLSDPPTAVFASNGDMALGALTAAQARGLPVPEKLAIAGFEDSYFAQSVWPPLTSIKVPTADMAERAVEALVQHNRARAGETMPVSSELHDYALVERASTGI